MNGEIVAQGTQFSLDDVQVVSATIDVEDVRAHRHGKMSWGMQASGAERYQRIEVNFALSGDDLSILQSTKIPIKYHEPEEEIACVDDLEAEKEKLTCCID